MTAVTATAAPSVSARRPGRAANITLWVAQVLLAAVYAGVAFPKVTLDAFTVAASAEMTGFSATGVFVLGLLEIAGAIGLLVPRLNGIAALGLVGLMIGAVIFTIAGMGIVMAALPAALGVIAGLIAWFRRYRTAELAGWLRTLTTR